MNNHLTHLFKWRYFTILGNVVRNNYSLICTTWKVNGASHTKWVILTGSPFGQTPSPYNIFWGNPPDLTGSSCRRPWTHVLNKHFTERSGKVVIVSSLWVSFLLSSGTKPFDGGSRRILKKERAPNQMSLGNGWKRHKTKNIEMEKESFKLNLLIGCDVPRSFGEILQTEHLPPYIYIYIYV